MDGARRDLLSAIQALGARESDPSRLAWARFELARLDQATGDLATARVLATQALEVFRATKDGHLEVAKALVANLRP